MSKARRKLTRRSSRRLFKRGVKIDTKNLCPPPQRGGYRM